MTARWNFSIHAGQTLRFRLSLHADEAAPAEDLTGQDFELRIIIDGAVHVLPATIDGEEAVFDFAQIDTAAWQRGRYDHAIWRLSVDENGREGAAPFIAGKISVEGAAG